MSVGSRRLRLTRRGLAIVGAGVCSAIAIGSVAFACTPVEGATYYSDGTTTKSGSSGTAITAYANAARPNLVFQLVAGTSTAPGHELHACMDVPGPINPNNRVSNFRGFIGNTTGKVIRPAGDWQICFGELPIDGNHSVTKPVFFTVI